MSPAPRSLSRILAATLALAVSAPAVGQDDAPAAAQEEGIRFEPIGSFFSRYELRENYANGTDVVRYRARLGAQTNRFDIGNDTQLKLRFVPQSAGFWNVGGDSLDDAGLYLHEGFIELAFPGALALQAGRFEMAYGDQLVIGPVGWHHSGRSFDGVRALVRPDGDVDLDIFATHLTEGVVERTSNDEIGGGDVWFFGAYAMLGDLLGDGQALDVYLLSRLAPRTTLHPGPSDTGVDPGPVALDTSADLTAGVRAKGASGDVDWRGEVDVQTGHRPDARDVDTFAYSADAEVGYTAGSDTTFRLGLNGFLASGDDPDTDKNEGYDHLFPTAHKWMGFMDFIGARSNVAGAALLLSSQIRPRWKAYANIYEFHRLQDGAQGAGRVGSEIDAGFRFGIGQGTGFRVGYGVFIPTEDVSDEVFHFAEFELKVELP